MATFTWSPAPGARRTIKPRVLSATLGDGYEQRVGDGINTQMASWAVSFNGLSVTDADSIDAFLKGASGVDAFDWTSPDGTVGKYVCREWDRINVGAERHNIFATFDQVPA